MRILFPFRQQCFQLFQRHSISNTIQTITMANVHTRARKSPYSGTEDVHVSISNKKLRMLVSS